MTATTWLVCIQEWNGCGYDERIVGPFGSEAEAETWCDQHPDLIPTAFDPMPPDEAARLSATNGEGES